MAKFLTFSAVVLGALVLATAAEAAKCGTIHARIEGRPSSTRVLSAGPSCATARRVARVASLGVFPEVIRVGGDRWRAGWPLSTRRTFAATYGRGANAVRLTTIFR